MEQALADIRVLDLGQLVQGPQAAATLADMGADVIKIELPQVGDLARWIFCSQTDLRTPYFEASNRGKRGMTLDLRTTEGASIFKQMVRSADVVISNFKPGTLEEWGLGYDDLCMVNKSIICAAGSTFGPIGPDAQMEGADLAGQCAGGLVSTIGYDGTPLSPVGATIADHIASQNLLSGILAALYSRERTGLGQLIEGSLVGGQIWAQASEYTHFLLTNEVPGRGHYSHPLLRGVYGIFQTIDGWIGIIGVPPDSRDAFFIAMGQPELALDGRYQGLLASREDLDELFELLNPVFQTKTTEQWSNELRSMSVRYAPVRDYRQAVADEGLWQNGYFQEAKDNAGSNQRIVGTPIRMSGTPLSPSGNVPELGQHTDEIMKNLGYSESEILALRDQHII